MQENIQSKQPFNNQYLDEQGLNIQAILNIDELPANIQESIRLAAINFPRFNQLILIGHLGRDMWQHINLNSMETDDPIDEYSVNTIQTYFREFHSENHYQILYPGKVTIGLQQLGAIAGWHNSSPFKVGINEKWGSWFAYRAVVLADTDFELTKNQNLNSPCNSCTNRECISSCPAQALDSGELNFNSCIEYRKQENSVCRNSCLARVSCPVGIKYKYTDDQVKYHYSISMKTIEKYY